jgi:hypothetical protein
MDFKEHELSREMEQWQYSACDLVERIEKSDYSKILRYKDSIPEKYHIYDQSPISHSLKSQYDPVTDGFRHLIFPTISTTDKKQPLYLAQTLHRALDECRSEYFQSNTPEVMREELKVWLFIFGEAIRQTSIHSKALAMVFDCIFDRLNSFVMDQTSETRVFEREVSEISPIDFSEIETLPEDESDSFQNGFIRLRHLLTHSNVMDTEREIVNNDIDKIERRVKVTVEIDCVVESLKQQIKKLQEDNKKALMVNFDMEQRNKILEGNLNEMMSLATGLREQLGQYENKIHSLVQSKTDVGTTYALGLAPLEVVQVWEQISHFCRSILDGDLLRLDLDSYFPKDITENCNAAFFQMKRPDLTDRELHYSKMYGEMQEMFGSEEQLFSLLERQIRELLKRVAEKYRCNCLEFASESEEISRKAMERLEEFHQMAVDDGLVVRGLVESSRFLRVPMKEQKAMDFSLQMKHLFITAQKMNNIKNVPQVVFQAFPDMKEFIAFIVVVTKLAEREFHVEMFRRFIKGDLPVSGFRFFARVYLSAYESSIVKRRDLLMTYFGKYGWGNLPRSVSTSIQNSFTRDPKKFCVLATAVYFFIIDRIETLVCDVDVETGVRNILSVQGKELFEVIDLMNSMSETGKATFRELAVVLFMRGVPFDGVLHGFQISQCALLTEFQGQGSVRTKVTIDESGSSVFGGSVRDLTKTMNWK